MGTRRGGAIATQALANLAYGGDGLALLAEGKSAADVVDTLTGADEGRDYRSSVWSTRAARPRPTRARGASIGPAAAPAGVLLPGQHTHRPRRGDAMADAFEGATAVLRAALARAARRRRRRR